MKRINILLIILLSPLIIIGCCVGFGDIILDMITGQRNSFGVEGTEDKPAKDYF